jgi:hypothetical protein
MRTDYPYQTNYGVLFPGWPVNETCAGIVGGSTVLAGLNAGLQNFYNSTGNRPVSIVCVCVCVDSEFVAVSQHADGRA